MGEGSDNVQQANDFDQVLRQMANGEYPESNVDSVPVRVSGMRGRRGGDTREGECGTVLNSNSLECAQYGYGVWYRYGMEYDSGVEYGTGTVWSMVQVWYGVWYRYGTGMVWSTDVMLGMTYIFIRKSFNCPHITHMHTHFTHMHTSHMHTHTHAHMYMAVVLTSIDPSCTLHVETGDHCKVCCSNLC